MASMQLAARTNAKKILGGHPRARWGLFCDGALAKKLEADGKLPEAGMAYVECGKHRKAVGIVRTLLANSDYAGASEIIIALWKKTGNGQWRLCAAKVAKGAEEEGKLEDAAAIYEKAGFGSMAVLVRKNLRLSRWVDDVGSRGKQETLTSQL